jgi:hypothetical protein
MKKNNFIAGDSYLPQLDWDTGGATVHPCEFVAAVEDANMVQIMEFATHTHEEISLTWY